MKSFTTLDGQESREPIGKRVFSENKQAVLIAMDLIARTNLEEVGEDDILERAMLLRLCFNENPSLKKISLLIVKYSQGRPVIYEKFESKSVSAF
uniref:Uncharacterized protein n=1 Tax=Vespula pensylvanica TaxID=30213 RepID=A0A834PBH2_VESPE|nr:hypothetical protein H0235_003188 [Vespula pensylvanica]